MTPGTVEGPGYPAEGRGLTSGVLAKAVRAG
jgi:hypothetical protein